MALCASSFQGFPLTGGTVQGSVNVTGHVGSSSAAPGMAAGAGAGTGPPAPAPGTGASDCNGSATFGTGTTPAAGVQVAVTFHAGYVNPPGVAIVAANALAQALGLFVTAVTASGFQVSCAVAPAASQANTTYAFDYVAIGV